jgi:fructose-1,6-bisphosphatase
MNDVKRLIIVGLGVIMAILLCLFIKNHADTDGWKTAYKYHIAITANKKDEFNYDAFSARNMGAIVAGVLRIIIKTTVIGTTIRLYL